MTLFLFLKTLNYLKPLKFFVSKQRYKITDRKIRCLKANKQNKNTFFIKSFHSFIVNYQEKKNIYLIVYKYALIILPIKRTCSRKKEYAGVKK